MSKHFQAYSKLMQLNRPKSKQTVKAADSDLGRL